MRKTEVKARLRVNERPLKFRRPKDFYYFELNSHNTLTVVTGEL